MRYKIILSLFALIVFSACNDGKLSDNDYITKVPRELECTNLPVGSFSSVGDEVTAKVRAENTGWEFICPVSWITVTPSSGKGNMDVRIKVDENKRAESRVAVLTLRSMENDFDYSFDFSIDQEGASPYITVSEKSITFSATAQTKTVTIDSNVDWETSCSAEWVSVSKASPTTLDITVSENVSSTRTAEVYLKSSGSGISTSWYISIVQQDADVTSETSELNFSRAGGTQSLNITAGASWEAKVSSVYSSWISVSPESGTAGSSTINVSVVENTSMYDRSGSVYVYIGGVRELSVPVNQDGVKYAVDVASLSFGSGVDTQSFSVDADYDWEIVSAPEWLSFSTKSGAAATGTTIKVTSADNPNTTSRSGKIVVGKDGFSGNQTIKVTQEGKNFSDLGDSMLFPNTASTQTLKVSTDGSWSASASDTWIHLSPASGVGEGEISVSVDANPENGDREGAVLVAVGATTKQITIIQKGKYIEISCDNLLTNSNPATINVSISSNIDWTVRSDADWMTPTPASGSGDATISVAVGDNPSAKERTGKIVFENSSSVKDITITQPGRTLLVDCLSLDIFYRGGESNPVTITTDGQFTISTPDSWITISQVGNIFKVSVPENDTNAVRTGSVVIALTDLTDGSTLSRTIEVKQFPKMADIIIGGFGDDEDWNF